jgi:hypothetical protein
MYWKWQSQEHDVEKVGAQGFRKGRQRFRKTLKNLVMTVLQAISILLKSPFLCLFLCFWKHFEARGGSR